MGGIFQPLGESKRWKRLVEVIERIYKRRPNPIQSIGKRRINVFYKTTNIL